MMAYRRADLFARPFGRDRKAKADPVSPRDAGAWQRARRTTIDTDVRRGGPLKWR
jgi:hypothetical protein